MRPVTRRLIAAVAAAAALALLLPLGADAGTNDPFRAVQWGLDQVRAEQAWPTSNGTGVVVAVVDSGVDLDHPDLVGRLVTGTTTLCDGKGVVTCGNGDWQSGARGGRTDCGNSGTSPCDSPHGTHVAGIIAAATNNGVGVASVAPGAKIMPVKAIDEDGGNDAQVSNGIRWAVDRGARVVNLSLGKIPGAQAFDLVWPEVANAVTYAASKGAVVVAAAGNDTFPLCGTPSWTAGAVCVTATDKREAPSFYTNGATKPDRLSVAAPGGSGLPICTEDVLSTVPVGQRSSGTNACTQYSSSKDYDEYAGTSMATPHVAGVAALLSAQGRSRQNVIDALIGTARLPRSTTRGVWNPEYGYGIVDAQAAVAFPGAAPSTTTSSTSSSTTSTTAKPRGKPRGNR